jgi:hypothetical protein
LPGWATQIHRIFNEDIWRETEIITLMYKEFRGKKELWHRKKLFDKYFSVGTQPTL